MDNKQQLVDRLFRAALLVEPEQRPSLLEAACGEDTETRQSVEGLLEQADRVAESRVLRAWQKKSSANQDITVDAPQQTPPYALNHQPAPAEETAAHVSEDSAAHRRPALFGAARGSSLTAGSVIAQRFEVLRFLSSGGMGEVYEAWDSHLGERVALKTIRPEIASIDDILERFRREVKQARAISHPNVCRIHELFSHEISRGNTLWFLTMEYLEGVTLSDYIRHHGPFGTTEAYGLLVQMVDGLGAAHAVGVIHRDFKSSNVMLVASASGRMRAVLTDFGLAFNILGPRGALKEPGGQGTPGFMAPEQRQTGDVTLLADEYALGVVMCEMVTGSLPVRANASTSAEAAPGQIKIKDPRWRAAVQRCLEPRPEDRFPRLSDVVAAVAPRKRSSRTAISEAAWVHEHA